MPRTLRITWTWATQREATASARCLVGTQRPVPQSAAPEPAFTSPQEMGVVTELSQLCSALVLSAGLKPKVCHLPCLHLPAIPPLHTTRNLSPANHRGPLCSHIQLSLLHMNLQIAPFQRSKGVFACPITYVTSCCLVYIVMCMHSLQVVGLLCVLLYVTVQSTVIRYLYFKSRMSESKHESMMYFSRYCTIRFNMI